jgi:IPT/TIG domain
MRMLRLLLITLFAAGCGNGMGNTSSHPRPVSVPPAIPSISELSPGSTVVNSVPFTITVNGENFGTDSVLFWNGNPQATFFVTPKQITARITSTDLQFAGMIPVYVRTAAQNSNTVDFDLTIQ